ncbi:DUF6602 domain-containing protein [Dactylosporangium salmoneum]|uniref:DUF6602 domain-containing protein n=1 Tax=Dactylosporangium salmoneum TaxID=53361 RepID=A0ABP5V4W1_9ACTN
MLDSEKIKPPHELETFLGQVSVELGAEYERIRARAVEDPGTAGDEGEENWRRLLADWLPGTLNIRTKGRILGIDGTLSPQVDLVILQPSYPPKLAEKKVYLAGGVIAAFECKLTLKREHIVEAAATARKIEAIANAINTHPIGTPRRDLRSPIAYGILAHSTVWRTEPAARIEAVLNEELYRDGHPRQMLDCVCVADTGFWSGDRLVMPPRELLPPNTPVPIPPGGCVYGQYDRAANPSEIGGPNPLHSLIGHLIQNLAWDLPDLRPLAQYWNLAQVAGAGMSMPSESRIWTYEVFSEYVRDRIRVTGPTQGEAWSPWGAMI